MKDYLQYVSDVLGVKAIMQDQPRVDSHVGPAYFYSANGAVAGGVFKKYSLVIVNWVQDPSESLFDSQVAELFGKMLAAMKISSEQVLVLDCVMNERKLIPSELFKICDPQNVLFFSHEPEKLSSVQLKGSANWLETLSPAVLLKDAGSKKLVWSDMQKIMKLIG